MSFTLNKFPQTYSFSYPQSKKRSFDCPQTIHLFFKDIFLFKAQIGQEQRSVVKLFLKMFPINNQEYFQLSSLNKQTIQ